MNGARALLLGCVLALAATPAAAARWALAGWTPGGDVVAGSAADFAAAVSAATRGALTLAPDAGGGGALEAVTSGRAPAAIVPLAALEKDEPALGMDRVPYLASNFVHARQLWQVLEPEVRRTLEARGLVLLYGLSASPPAPLSGKALTALEDWRGTRMLAGPPSLGDLARILGATAVAGSSAREAMAGGKADIAFLSAVEAADGKAWEYAAHYLHAPAWFPKHVVVARRDAVDALGDAERAALMAAARGAEQRAWARVDEATEDGVQKLRDHAVRTDEPPVGLLIRLEALGRELLFLWSDAAGETGARMVEAYYAIR